MTPVNLIIDETRTEVTVFSPELGKVLQINILDLARLNSDLLLAQAKKISAQNLIDLLTPLIVQLQSQNPPIIP